MKLRFVGISTSPRDYNTLYIVKEALNSARNFVEKFGHEADIELISFKGKRILPCYNCDLCIENKTLCVLKDDWLDLVKPLIDPVPDGLIFGSPVYFFNTNSMARAFMERFTCLEKKIWDPTFPYDPPDFSKTVAAAVSVGFDRNGGVEQTVSTIIQWMLVVGFTVVGGFYIGGMAWTHEKDGKDVVKEDEIGLKAVRLCGYKVAKVALMMKGVENLPNITWNFSI